MTNTANFLLLQLNDATFPIGSYSLSWGLETFVQQGFVHDMQSARKYIYSDLCGSFLYSELLPARFAWENAGNEKKLQLLDELYDVSRTPLELREGSKKLANRFNKTTAVWQEEKQKRYIPLYYPIAYGSYCRLHKTELYETLSTFLYSQTSARVTTSVKLVPLSQTDGQIILNNLIKVFPDFINLTLSLSEDDLFRSCPGTDIRAMQHEYLYTRLYMS